jgi:hypothetical protein
MEVGYVLSACRISFLIVQVEMKILMIFNVFKAPEFMRLTLERM